MIGASDPIPDVDRLDYIILDNIDDITANQLVPGAMFVSRKMHENIECFVEAQYHAIDLRIRIAKYIMSTHVGIVPIIDVESVMNAIYYWLPGSFVAADNSTAGANDPYFSEYCCNWDKCADEIKDYVTKAIGNYPFSAYIGDSVVCGGDWISMSYKKPPSWVSHEVNSNCFYVLSSASCISGVPRIGNSRYMGSYEINGILLDLCEIHDVSI